MGREHWWLKDKPFERVRLSTLYRLALLFQADFHAGKVEVDSSGSFLLWLDKYMEDQSE